MEEFKLEKVNLKNNCFSKQEKGLKKYQRFISYYLNNHDELLLFHSVGSGKTASMVNAIYNEYKKDKKINIILFIKAALHDGWEKEFKKWLKEEDLKILDNIYIIHYDSIFSGEDFIKLQKKLIKEKKDKNNYFYIIDEAHNFINNVLSNKRINKEQGRALIIYSIIFNQKKELMENKKSKQKIKIVLMSATPIVNEPYELSLIFNLFEPNIFPLSKYSFNKEYIDDKNKFINQEEFIKKIKKYVSYYYGVIPNLYAESKKKVYLDIMSNYQTKVYTYYKNLEETDPKHWDHYKVYSRQSSNFAFPYINKSLNALTRPLLKNYGGIEAGPFAEELNRHINAFYIKFDEAVKEDEKNNHTIKDDLKITKSYKEIIEMINNNKSSNLLKEMYNCSCKYLHCCLNIIQSKGPVIVYTYWTWGSSCVLEIYLKYFGFGNYAETKKEKKYDNYRYTFYNGMETKKRRDNNKNTYNIKENIRGKIIKVMILSSSGAEGLSLFNVRQIHIIEPFWNDTRNIQVEGRGIRLCSHMNLPKEEQNVKVYYYNSITEKELKNKKKSTDLYLNEIIKRKSKLNEEFLKILKLNSIDYKLNYEHTKFDKSLQN